jgi:hypothetical protein
MGTLEEKREIKKATDEWLPPRTRSWPSFRAAAP